MLVSARIDETLRANVAAGLRPEPEYLVLERDHDFDLLDWSMVDARAHRRSPLLAIRHAMKARARIAEYDGVLSDGEHLGLPLALGMQASGAAVRHAMIGHHLTTAKKRMLLGAARARLRDSHLIVHCDEQLEFASRSLGMSADHVHLVPYGIDVSFWHPMNMQDEGFVMAAGKDHRDYVTFVEACEGAADRVFVAGSSLHSAGATWRAPESWPEGFQAQMLDFTSLRARYGACSLFVLPLLATDFQAGVTALLEAMAMGKAVVATANRSVKEVVVDGETGLLVPPGDPHAMREAILDLMANPSRRRRLGRNARDAVERRHGLYDYAANLHAVTLGAVATPVC